MTIKRLKKINVWDTKKQTNKQKHQGCQGTCYRNWTQGFSHIAASGINETHTYS
jgi:hypothetical protein